MVSDALGLTRYDAHSVRVVAVVSSTNGCHSVWGFRVFWLKQRRNKEGNAIHVSCPTVTVMESWLTGLWHFRGIVFLNRVSKTSSVLEKYGYRNLMGCEVSCILFMECKGGFSVIYCQIRVSGKRMQMECIK